MATSTTIMNEEQRLFLVKLIKQHPIITSKKTEFSALNQRKEAWEELEKQYNIHFSTAEPKTLKQLKRAWEWIRKK